MPSIIWKSRSIKQEEMQEKAREFGETNDCTVRTLALLAGCDYKKAHEVLADLGRKMGKGVSIVLLAQAFIQLGYRLEKVSLLYFIKQYPKAHQILRSVTSHHPDRFKKVWKDGNNYLMSYNHHVSAVLNGENHDWSKNRAIRVWSVYRVIKLTGSETEDELCVSKMLICLKIF